MAVDQPCERLPMRTISPLRMYQTTPLPSRRRVTRRVTSSTVPIASPVSMTSPTPYWSSTIMKMPDRKSLTRLCAPNPSATPPTPAEASSGPSGRPSSPITVRIAIAEMANVDVLLRIAPIVAARCRCRSDAEPVATDSTRAARPGVRRSRSSARCTVPRTTRSIDRCSSHRSTTAPMTVTRMRSPSERSQPTKPSAVVVASDRSRDNMADIMANPTRAARGRGPGGRACPSAAAPVRERLPA